MDVNAAFLWGLNPIQLCSLPLMLTMFIFAVWFGVRHNPDKDR